MVILNDVVQTVRSTALRTRPWRCPPAPESLRRDFAACPCTITPMIGACGPGVGPKDRNDPFGHKGKADHDALQPRLGAGSRPPTGFSSAKAVHDAAGEGKSRESPAIPGA